MHPISISALLAILLDAASGLKGPHSSRCDGRSCNPPIGNLAMGRVVSTLSTCGQNGTELYCSFPDPLQEYSLSEDCQRPICAKCNSRHPDLSHLPFHMTDNAFLHPRTWWQSSQGLSREEIRLDLETDFYLTHVIVLFKSPRPAAMLLERSQDYGRTWRPYKYYATNCTETFGMPDDLTEEGALCTSRYSNAAPCTKGEVIFRALSFGSRMDDPYSAHVQDQLKLTSLRIQLLKQQECSCQSGAENTEKPQRFAHYAIYDLIVRGSCYCNGHAEQCQPIPGASSTGKRVTDMVHGKCICQHNTAGDHCEKCAPLYNDLPWRPGNGKTGATNECRKCQCHGHADSCHFDPTTWQASGKRTGGVCDGCKHNTDGKRCQRCRAGHYRDQAQPLSSPSICKPCSCHPVGSINSSSSKRSRCHPKSGFCYCKPGVAGPHCTQCMMGYWGFGEAGCKPCECARDCDHHTGECLDSFDQKPSDNIPFRDKIPNLNHLVTNDSIEEYTWEDEQGFSALRHPEKCICKEKSLGGVSDFCKMKFAYVIKARVLSAHDKGTHAEVMVMIKKILKSGKLKILRGDRRLYPEAWTNRGCTCPVLNPGTDYLIAGHEESRTGKLLVNMSSLVKPWKPALGKLITDILVSGCERIS
ncbi:netrin-4-like isoform X1 [Erpetoichthys calabaricus]|uniref:netrin-4-like isoform X1 n=1 Tax=Erpetoichthys calabaricus TaxID=27687 RepID=UPI002233E70E|nr:netrin-4-like isoform X1 [Erpetoichthys calabaricus]